MAKIYNDQKNILVKYIYGECDLFEILEIEHAIQESETFRHEYQKLKKSKLQLLKLTLSPTDSSIDRILNYSRREKGAVL